METATGARVGARRLGPVLLLGGLFVWAWDSRLLWPLKLLVVMVHEAGHAVATWLVGGRVLRVTLSSNQAGQCLSQVPQSLLAQVLVYSAGYVGSAVVGALLLTLTFRLRAHRAVLTAAAAGLGFFGLVLGGDLFTIAFCLLAGAALGLCAWKLPTRAVELINLTFAVFCSLYAVADLRDDLWDSAVRSQSDAALLADLTWVPAVVWAALWSLASLGVLGAVLLGSARSGQRRVP